MDKIFVTIECEVAGFLLLCASKDRNELSGWLVNGSVLSLLAVCPEFAEGTNFSQTLSAILKEKEFYFARISSANSSVEICKKVDDILVKILELRVMELSSSLSMDALNFARSMESTLVGAQAQISSQEAELASLSERCQQLLDKYTAAAEEKAALRESLLAAFSSVLNAKKARIAELEARDQGSGGDADADEAASSERSVELQTLPLPVKQVGGGKRKPPAKAAPAKPAVRRTRSSTAKKPRSGGDDDDDEAS